MSEAAFEVTFQIAVPNPGLFPQGDDKAPLRAAELVELAADVVRQAAGLRPTEEAAHDLRRELSSGRPLRVRLSATQLARFFILRRSAGQAIAHRLKWKDAEETAA